MTAGSLAMQPFTIDAFASVASEVIRSPPAPDSDVGLDRQMRSRPYGHASKCQVDISYAPPLLELGIVGLAAHIHLKDESGLSLSLGACSIPHRVKRIPLNKFITNGKLFPGLPRFGGCAKVNVGS